LNLINKKKTLWHTNIQNDKKGKKNQIKETWILPCFDWCVHFLGLKLAIIIHVPLFDFKTM